ncbi:MAG: hypothetical protein ABSD68_01635 [Candidatus Micrarchaeales archaeon]|jgi:hypothetical protein
MQELYRKSILKTSGKEGLDKIIEVMNVIWDAFPKLEKKGIFHA